MSTDSLASLPLHVYDFQAFECTNCGRCCNKRWKVTIDPHQIEGIQKSQAYKERVRDGYTPLTIGEDGFAKVGAHDGNYCSFFTEDRWCTLHGELGLYGKPRGCQLFPYHANDTPDGTFVTMSFACPPVVAGKDRDVETNRRDLQHVLDYRRSLAPEPLAEDFRVKLTPQLEISWDSYRELESRILAAYRADRPYESLLAIVLGVLRGRHQPEGGQLYASVDEDLSFPKEILDSFMDGLLDALRDREGANDGIPSAEIGENEPTFLATLVAQQRPHLSFVVPEGSLLPEIFNRYFLNLVLGKGLLKTSVVERLLTLLCGMVLVQLYGAAYQRYRQEPELTLDAITLAFDFVEMNVVTHNLSLGHIFASMTDTFEKVADLPPE